MVIAGPTGSGKSELALLLAERIGGEIVNYDSVQLYRDFDIGSAKPPLAARSRVPHHLYDVIDPREPWNAADYARVAGPICAEIENRGKRVLLVGGTGFYLRALLSGLPEMPGRDDAIRERLRRLMRTDRGQARLHRWLGRVDPAAASKIAPADRNRLERALEIWILTAKPITSWTPPAASAPARVVTKLALRMPRPLLNERIDQRVASMYEAGLVEETRELLSRYPDSARAFGSIGYAEAVRVVRGELDEDAAMAETRRRTRAYAKRQMTWLRGERDVHWIEAADGPEFMLEQALAVLDQTVAPDKP